MEFNPESLDFLKTFDNFKKKYGASIPNRYRFGTPIVSMADAIITTNFDRESVKGVKQCLEYEIGHISWRNHIWLIPLHKTDLFFSSKGNRKVISLLADSLILTLVAYRVQLNEHHTGLANIYFNEITAGFEWVCDWISRGIEINQKDNEVIEVFDVSHIESFIIESRL